MKINELISNFTIHTTNEDERKVDKLQKSCNIDIFNEREQTVIDHLVRKSLVSKTKFQGSIIVRKNEDT
jgi:hypothetical protein